MGSELCIEGGCNVGFFFAILFFVVVLLCLLIIILHNYIEHRYTNSMMLIQVWTQLTLQ